jgi:hypothetical protein
MGLYVFRALLAHLQEALHKRHLVYCIRDALFMTFIKNYGLLHVSNITWSSSGVAAQTALGILLARTQYKSAVCAVPPEDEQVMLETCRGH